MDQLNSLLGVEREMNIQLLKQNNGLMEEMDKMKESSRAMEKKIKDLEMVRIPTYR